jgi:hypothetical protein
MDVVRPRNDQGILDDRAIKLVCYDLSPMALPELGGVASVVIMKVRDENVLELHLVPVQLLHKRRAHTIVGARSTIAGIEEEGLPVVLNQKDAPLNITVQLVSGPVAMNARDSPPVGCPCFEEDHRFPPLCSTRLRVSSPDSREPDPAR